MWRILNKLFGYDYIVWNNGFKSGIARVHVNDDGVVYCYSNRMRSMIEKINSPDQVFWLTCKSNKYFKEENKK